LYGTQVIGGSWQYLTNIIIAFLVLALLLVLLLAVILLLKIWLMKKAVREIIEQMSESLLGDTNKKISVSSGDSDINRLAADLNKELAAFRKQQICYYEGDRELKSAITNISHDLRTPLAAIYGYMDLLSREDFPEPLSRYFQIIRERLSVIKELTDQLMKYSIIVFEKQELVLTKLSIRDILEESLLAFYAILREKEIVPEIVMCEEKVYRNLDRNALIRIFSNLITNVVRYSDGDFKITLSQDGKITFSNHAAMLDEVTVNRLFERFFTVENARKTTGLGLSIAKVLTEQMGGSITAQYQDGMVVIAIVFE